MKKILLINGGILIGDTFHLIPFFELYKEYDITWVTGTYSQHASKCIQYYYPNISKLIIIEDGIPNDISHREKFKDNIINNKNIDTKEYDIIIDKINLSFDFNQDIGYKHLPINNNIVKLEPYIVVQQECVHNFKKIQALYDVKFPIKAYSICTKNQFAIDNTIRFEGSLIEISKLIAGCTLFVGIHSGINCLAYYIPNIKGITLHFWDGLLEFSNYRNDGSWIDLKRSDCTKKNIEENINKMLEVHNAII